MNLPQRPASHDLETKSQRFFENLLPSDWTSEKQQADYGVDLVVRIFDNGYASNYELIVQLKASHLATEGVNEKVRLNITSYNHLKKQLHVAMLVKYVEELNEAFYTLLIDIPAPSQKQKSFTVNIPKENTLSSINWKEIEDYIREIVDYKLAAADAIRRKRSSKRKS